MKEVRPEILRIMRDNCQTKVQMILSCKMVRDNEDESTQLVDAHFLTEMA